MLPWGAIVATRQATLGVVGGASGVGKTTLLSAVAWLSRVNTGDLFKKHMAVANRDDIRASNWAAYEEVVADELIEFVSCALNDGRDVVIDTHFAAKLNGSHYRIGLDRKVLFRLAAEILSEAERQSIALDIKVIHIDSDAHQLLKRRRLDVSRNRELTPSDCVRALERNRICAGQYFYEIARAQQANNDQGHLSMTRIGNTQLERSIASMKRVFGGEAYA
jgi:adenylate kinase